MTDKHWQRVLDLLWKWHKKPESMEEKKALKAFMQENWSFAKNVVSKFDLRTVQEYGHNVVQLHRTDTKRAQKGSLVVPNSKTLRSSITCMVLRMRRHTLCIRSFRRLAYYNITFKQYDALSSYVPFASVTTQGLLLSKVQRSLSTLKSSMINSKWTLSTWVTTHRRTTL